MHEEYIITFNAYQTQKDLFSLLNSLLIQYTDYYRLVPRNNMALEFPTDFVLIQIEKTNHKIYDSLLSFLHNCEMIRNIGRNHKVYSNSIDPFKQHNKQKNEFKRGNNNGRNDANNKTTNANGRADPNHTRNNNTQKKKKYSGINRDTVSKILGNGKRFTRFSWNENNNKNKQEKETKTKAKTSLDNENSSDSFQNYSFTERKLLSKNKKVTQLIDDLNVKSFWNQGYLGSNVKIAIFDTGLNDNNSYFKNVKERINWTDENTLDDLVGHGTFVASILSSTSGNCGGLAPESDLYIYRIFTKNKISYTSWFLDAFNYALFKKINILNLSIGGPDYNDLPFVEKVNELTANGIILISAIGNDGPLYGTLNNPGDQSDVIGVGAIDSEKGTIGAFSSRGMTTWELPFGYGRFKPDLVAPGKNLLGLKPDGKGCTTLSGTSVASPVVAGSISLLASSIEEKKRWKILNPASAKQILLKSSTRQKSAMKKPKIYFPNNYNNQRREIWDVNLINNQIARKTIKDLLCKGNIFEQGSGLLNLPNSLKILQSFRPHASAFPESLDFTDCPYYWPYCSQPLYYSSMPVMVNFTILNSMDVTGYFLNKPTFKITSIKSEKLDFMKKIKKSDMINIQFSYSDVIWPWTGYLVAFLEVGEKLKNMHAIIDIEISLTIRSILLTKNPNNNNNNFDENDDDDDEVDEIIEREIFIETEIEEDDEITTNVDAETEMEKEPNDNKNFDKKKLQEETDKNNIKKKTSNKKLKINIINTNESVDEKYENNDTSGEKKKKNENENGSKSGNEHEYETEPESEHEHEPEVEFESEYVNQNEMFSIIKIPIKIEIIPTPPKERRILWDQYHNLNYPSGFFPSDDLSITNDQLDCRGDHIHTNFRTLYTYLRANGFYVEVLNNPFTCFDAENYQTLLIVDSEEEFFKEEIEKINKDVLEKQLNVIIFADWYNQRTIEGLEFFDKNTKRMWIPAMGGANLPALNDLLTPYGIAFGNHIFSGEFLFNKKNVKISSSSSIYKFPKNGKLFSFVLKDETDKNLRKEPILGIYQPKELSGEIMVFGDSNCLDDTNNLYYQQCFSFLETLIKYGITKKFPEKVNSKLKVLSEDFVSQFVQLPQRLKHGELKKYSHVLNEKSPICRTTRSDFRRTNVIDEHEIFAGIRKNLQRDSHLTKLFLYPYLILCVIAIFLSVFFIKKRKREKEQEQISKSKPKNLIV
ncbi:membrane-bound transcription factor site-1 protease [Anaeramoeba flamelloides]|uniref:Membrane-bound transcription factor site-1 protease n=1 Tax=Anaeramoeba flamelloides TaxID=1746091 RepID=A0AAV8A5R7_9EUKA|nr:membrane-bound transcription factor site-1 protease [Anaeramoeba flamelloides]